MSRCVRRMCREVGVKYISVRGMLDLQGIESRLLSRGMGGGVARQPGKPERLGADVAMCGQIAQQPARQPGSQPSRQPGSHLGSQVAILVARQAGSGAYPWKSVLPWHARRKSRSKYGAEKPSK